MGGCLSIRMITCSNNDNDDKLSSSSANIITTDGQLRQFLVPITVSQILQQLDQPPQSNCFIANSDSLFYDELVPALSSENELQSGQIYFILPNSKLRHPLSASDMAALAVKASLALSTSSNNNARRSKSRISPVLTIQSVNTVSVVKSDNNKKAGAGLMGISRSGSVRRLQRYSSRRTKLAVRSFRLRLSTIYEGSDIQQITDF